MIRKRNCECESKENRREYIRGMGMNMFSLKTPRSGKPNWIVGLVNPILIEKNLSLPTWNEGADGVGFNEFGIAC